MYCVKCGVHLQDSVTSCPLCNTPVLDPEGKEYALWAATHQDELSTGRNRKKDSFLESNFGKTGYFPERYPEKGPNIQIIWASIFTALFLLAEGIILIISCQVDGANHWTGYAIFGILLLYILGFLPVWFKRPNMVIFIPCDFVAIAGYLLFICLKTGGNWFFGFALPLVLYPWLVTSAFAALLKYVRGGRYFIFGSMFLSIGLYAVYIEYFEYLMFAFPMFRWSLYVASSCGIVGMFLILVGIIRPLQQSLKKRFFF